MLMLCQILLCAKHAEATQLLSLAMDMCLAQLLLFAIQNLASFSPENAHISSLNPMKMF